MDVGPDMDSLLDALEKNECSKAMASGVMANDFNNSTARNTSSLELNVSSMQAVSKCLNDSSPSPPSGGVGNEMRREEECAERPMPAASDELPIVDTSLSSDIELESRWPMVYDATVVLPIPNSDLAQASFEASSPPHPPPLPETICPSSPDPIDPIDVYDEIEQMERLIRAESSSATGPEDVNVSLPEMVESAAPTTTSVEREVEDQPPAGLEDAGDDVLYQSPGEVPSEMHVVEEGEGDLQPSAADDMILPSNTPTPFVATDRVAEKGVSVVASLHVISSEDNEEHRLTESELMLGKTKPFWIPDADCASCMLCTRAFTLVNRRHHCRSCGRLLCGACCSTRRHLPYMKEEERKQRICAPCNKTLDRIESYEKGRESAGEGAASAPTPSSSSSIDVNPSSTEAVGTSADEGQPYGSSPGGVTGRKKKSVLKARHIPIAVSGIPEEQDGETAEGESTSGAVTHPISASLPIIAPGPESLESQSIFSRSVSTQQQSQTKRSVTFRDGVNPGDESAESSIRQAHQPSSSSSFIDERDETLMILNGGGLSSRGKKSSKRLSRRAIERRADEEQTSLLPATPEPPCHCYLLGPRGDFNRGNLIEASERIHSGGDRVTIALKRNLYVVVRRGELPMGDSNMPVIAYSTRGFNAIGVDELVLVFEARVEGHAEDTRVELLEILLQMEELFGKCLAPTDDTLDDRMGIRRCVKRMIRMYPIGKGRLGGMEAAAILFHRPRGQFFGDILSDMPERTPFLLGTLLKREEVAWAIALANRVLMRIGLHASCYPVPLVNQRERAPLFERIEETGHSSVMKIYTDFHTWSYRMTKLPGSTASLTDKSTTVVIPEWCREELRAVVENNRSMVGWALDFNDSADSHLVCEQSGCDFKTKVFTNSGQKRRVTGANFVIFDGALKMQKKSGEDSSFVASVVEDGVIVRLSADTMEELVKSLLAGEDFRLATNVARLEVLFRASAAPLHTQGALTSAIDGRNLEGHYEYGLVLSRQFRSHSPLPSISEWSLRLSAVVNMVQGRFPHILQPKYFELCEQLAMQITPTLEPFIPSLICCQWRRICVRVRVDEDCVSYETEKWDGAELADQHFIWTLTLDEQLVPFLYSLCAVAPNGFYVEMHMSIISTKPLPSITDCD